jgi:hypothetical protein
MSMLRHGVLEVAVLVEEVVVRLQVVLRLAAVAVAVLAQAASTLGA